MGGADPGGHWGHPGQGSKCRCCLLPFGRQGKVFHNGLAVPVGGGSTR